MNPERIRPERRVTRAAVFTLSASLALMSPAAFAQVAPAPATRPAAATRPATRPSADEVAFARAVRILRDIATTADAKAAACDVLRGLGPRAEPAVSDLVDALWNPGPIRDAAAAALRAVGKPAVNTLILEASLANPRAETAKEIVRGMPAAAEVVPDWVAALRSKETWRHGDAARALGVIGPAGGEAAAKVLIDTLRGPSATGRANAVWALGQVRPDADLAAAAAVVASYSTDDRVSFEAAQWLQANLGTADQALRPVVLAALVDASGHKNPRIGALARDALAEARMPAALVVPVLAEKIASLAAPTDRPPVVNVRALAGVMRLLNRYGPDAAPAAPVLANLLVTDWPPVSDAAAGALIAIGPDAAPVVIGRLRDKDVATRRAAVSLLPDLYPTGGRTVTALVAALRDADPTVAAAAAEALGRCAPRPVGARPALTAALNDRDPDVRRAAKDALRLIGTGGE